MPSGGHFGFGPYRLDVRSHRLARDGRPVPLQPRQFHLLSILVERAGEIVTSRELMDTVWKDLNVGPGSLSQAVWQLRVVLDRKHPTRYVETVPRVGYRFVATVTHGEAKGTDADIETRLAPYRAAVESRAALESLQLDRADRAASTYEELVRRRDDDPRSHVGLANAYLARHDATRADARPDVNALDLADEHAREATRLDLRSADAWATLAQILERRGDRDGAMAAHRLAMDLEPNEGVHVLRFGMTAFGRDRLAAARRLDELMPGLPAARWLTSTVHVARNALVEAKRALDPGLAAIAHMTDAATAFPPVALFWLDGLLSNAQHGDIDAALASFARERAMDAGHIYGRETEANTCYAIGGCEFLRGNTRAARDAFGEALALVPGHLKTRAGLALIDGVRLSAEELAHALPLDQATAEAVRLVADHDSVAAARLVADALRRTPPGHAGWTIPIDPLLGVQRNLDAWAEVLAILRERAR